MSNIMVTRDALRELVRRAMKNKKNEAIDPVDSITNPGEDELPVDPGDDINSDVESVEPPIDDESYVPANTAELAEAAEALVKDLPPGEIETFWKHLKKIVTMASDRASETSAAPTFENRRYNHLRRRVMEAIGDDPFEYGVDVDSFGGRDSDYESDVNARGLGGGTPSAVSKAGKRRMRVTMPLDKPERFEKKPVKLAPVEAPRKAKKQYDMPERSAVDVAAELGMGPSDISNISFVGKKKLMYMARMASEAPARYNSFVSSAIKDYIDTLSMSKAIDDSDRAFLRQHPDHVRELDGFREFIDEKIQLDMNKAGVWPHTPKQAGAKLQRSIERGNTGDEKEAKKGEKEAKKAAAAAKVAAKKAKKD